MPHHTGKCVQHSFQAHGTVTHLLVELHRALSSLLPGLLLIHPDLRALEAWQHPHTKKSGKKCRNSHTSKTCAMKIAQPSLVIHQGGHSVRETAAFPPPTYPFSVCLFVPTEVRPADPLHWRPPLFNIPQPCCGSLFLHHAFCWQPCSPLPPPRYE